MSDTSGMFILITGIAAMGVFGALASRFGAETRPGFDERPEPQMHRYIP
jgi:hypothetical protein